MKYPRDPASSRVAYFKRDGQVLVARTDTYAVDMYGRNVGGRGYVRAYLGRFRLVLETTVSAVAVFDDSGHLRDVIVFKETDGF